MGKLNRLHQLTGWLVFGIAAIVYLLSAERTGSLWDCGEFVLGAYKMQVVHPPGAPLFLLIGRIFSIFGGGLSAEAGSNPAMIAFAVNAMSGICTAFAAAFVAWMTIMLSKIALLGRDETAELGSGQNVAVAASGLVAGLATAFSTSVWFSAVEGEVYAMSLFFTCLTAWAMIRWYAKPDTPEADRWLLFALFASGLSIGVHLLSILTIPAMGIFYYFKKKNDTNLVGLGLSVIAGVAIIIFIQSFIIVGIPTIWQFFEIPMVNGGMPVHSGLIPTLLLLAAVMFFGLRYAHRKNNAVLQQIMVGFGLMVIAFSTVGVVVLRAEAKTPVNMNNPDNVTSLLPYLNREQYGERSLLYGQTFTAEVTNTEVTPRYGLVDGKYEPNVTQKITPEYSKKMFFSRMYDNTQGRVSLYKQWMGLDPSQPLPRGRPNQGDNIKFFVNYQLGWMYWRYFMWNFSGRQNGEQGFYSWDDSSGNWITGIKPLDEARLGDLDALPEYAKEDPARNTYFLLPFLFGLIGLFWHASRSSKEFIGLLTLFVITGIGIIVYTNQPPNEPRERDYVLVGSFFVFCMWMGMAVPAMYELARTKLNQKGFAVAGGIGAVVLIAPLLMGFQNWDDHSRAQHSGARDYAANFLNSVDQNAIIFTYGDNDTYPLWYAQEVENIRPDVRVVNLSLIAVDWYIDLLRYKMNDSPPIKLGLSQDLIRGRLRNQVPYLNRNNQTGNCAADRPTSLDQLMQTIASRNPVPLRSGSSLETQYASCNVGIQVDPRQLSRAPWLVPEGEQAQQRIPIRISNSRLLKDEIAILDIINSNLYDRPIYWAVTCQQSKLMGLENFLELEGLGLKLTVTHNPSDSRNYGIIGSGGINTEKTANLVMNTWQWGNFDKVDTHISSSYQPAVQSMQIVIMRTMEALMAEGKTNEALAVGDKYFASFPDMNFPFFYQTYLMLQPYFQANQLERAQPILEQLARNTADRLDYYDTLDETRKRNSYEGEVVRAEAIARGMLQQVRARGSEEIRASIEQILGNHLYLVPEAGPQNPG
ncbi:DUF2723 domain-containing protein [Neolewinella agarilytica]|uniref:glycosyltransferase family 117 protein n=1 Tax=Neolewinella agarilytica TaxID=478744 RepID=UPI002351FE67|nr:DUF2723 domain-containing protein [Neolewinella agarilytica]